MEKEFENPFSVTKASEYNDSEINEYWVNLNFNSNNSNSFNVLLNPNEYLPKYIIGGKGCGKTHILRYFSYASQKIRYENDTQKILLNDKYIGIYSILHGLSSSRFEGKNIDNSQWQSIFEYYFELYIVDGLLKILIEIIDNLKIEQEQEELILAKIKKFFRIPINGNIDSISSFNEFLGVLRDKIDFQILNAAFSRKLEYEEIKVLFNPGDLIFGIPQAFKECNSTFEDVKFIYILDEYEKLFHWQKVFVNTLVWDKKNPVTFWIGARRYGYTTRETKSNESMKIGSEFQEVKLDDIISSSSTYPKFAEQLILKRLLSYYQQNKSYGIDNSILEKFKSKFCDYSEEAILNEIKIKNAKRKYDYKHLQELRDNIKSGINVGKALDIKERNIIKLIDAVKEGTDHNPLLQKYKVFYIYREWANASPSLTFNAIIKKLKDEFKLFKLGKSKEFDEIIDKRKKDFLVALCRDNQLKNPEYIGFDNFIQLSEGNVRTLILLLKKTLEYSKIKGEKPLEDGGKISIEAQSLAIHDTASWYFEDVKPLGDAGRYIENALLHLTNYLILHRFCDKPTEPSLAYFYTKSALMSNSSKECIEEMLIHGFLRENDKGRKDKNSGIIETSYRISKILCPLWNIPIINRGNILLSPELTNCIFDFEKQDKFNSLYIKTKNKLNAPNFVRNPNSPQGSLF